MWIELLLDIIILIYDTTHRFKRIAYCAFFKQASNTCIYSAEIFIILKT